MQWYVVYKRKPLRGTIQENLDDAGITYFVPVVTVEKLNNDGTKIERVNETAIKNLIFIQTDQDIMQLINNIDGLRCPMIDCVTGKPAIVPEKDMMQFRRLVELRSQDIKILNDVYSKFQANQKVRVRAGAFEGIEGRVVRILKDRKLVISLGNIAVAISGIDRSLFETIE